MNTIRSRGLLTGFTMVFATLLVTAALGYLNVRRLYEHDRLVDHTHQVVSELRHLLALVADAESGMRGFALTADVAYLQPYETAQVTVPDTVDRIGRLTADNAEQQASLGDLKTYVARRMELMDTVIAAVEQGGAERGRVEVTKGEGQAMMEQLRDAIRTMERREDSLLTRRIGEATAGYWTAVISSLLSAMIGLSLAVMGLLLAMRDLQARELRTQELKELNDRLEERVRERTAEISQSNAALRDEVVERQRAEKNVRLAVEELDRSNRELAQFATVASHDLQEPLRKIQAFGDRLLGQSGDALSGKAREYLDRMLAATGRMRALIDGLLEYSRVSTRAQPAIPVDLDRVAHEVVGDLEARLHSTEGRVQIDKLPTIPADPLQMRQLLQNLIGNALKFQHEGTPPLVRVWARVVPGSIHDNGNSQRGLVCELSVEDNGVGFEPAYAERIFELFQRLHGRSEYEGTGMGLAICKKIAERHGGSISAASTPGKGSRFLVKLPLISQSPGDEPEGYQPRGGAP